MNVIFLGGIFPSELKDTITANSMGPMANANNALQWALVSGLGQLCKSLEVVALPQVGAYPRRYKSLFVDGQRVAFPNGVKGESVGFFNLAGVKHWSRYRGALRALTSRIEQTPAAPPVLIIYDLHAPFLKAATAVKKRYPGVAICVVVPDLPGFTGGATSVLHKMFYHIEGRSRAASYDAIDSYVLLSKHMVELLPVGERPWVVVEGIFDSVSSDASPDAPRDPELRTVFYSGALDRRNGLPELLDAFRRIAGKNYRLVLCGDGDMRDDVQAAASADSRIIFKGQIARSEVLALQRQATLLVNPRPPDAEFTRYSFPSKTMEYLASGVPVLMHQLEGVPDEYYEHCYCIEGGDGATLAQSIATICETAEEELAARGAAARAFVLQRKNPVVQCSKILDLAVARAEKTGGGRAA